MRHVAHIRDDKCMQNFSRESWRDDFGPLGTHKRIILKWILNGVWEYGLHALVQETDQWCGYVNTIMQGCIIFFQKCRRRIKILAVRRVNMKQVLCWRPTNIRRYRTKFSRLFDLAPRCYIQGEEFLCDLDEWGYEEWFCCKELLQGLMRNV